MRNHPSWMQQFRPRTLSAQQSQMCSRHRPHLLALLRRHRQVLPQGVPLRKPHIDGKLIRALLVSLTDELWNSSRPSSATPLTAYVPCRRCKRTSPARFCPLRWRRRNRRPKSRPRSPASLLHPHLLRLTGDHSVPDCNHLSTTRRLEHGSRSLVVHPPSCTGHLATSATVHVALCAAVT